MKKLTQILSLCLALVLLLALVACAGNNVDNGAVATTTTTTATTTESEEQEEEPTPELGGGLAFKSNNNGTCVLVGIGTCTDKDLVIPDKSPDGDTVTSIAQDTFRRCEIIETLVIPEGVESVLSNAFYNCDNLKSVTIPASTTSIYVGAFAGCNSLESINVAEDNPYFLSEDGILFNKDKTAILQYPAGKTDKVYTIPDGVTDIGGWWAFEQCNNLESVIIGDSVKRIGYAAFTECYGLKSVTIGKGVETISDWAFSSCVNLDAIYYGGTMGEWNNIYKENSWNDNTKKYTVYCIDGQLSK